MTEQILPAYLGASVYKNHCVEQVTDKQEACNQTQIFRIS